MNVLVVNCGSSSIKFVLCTMPENKILAKGGVEKLGMPDAFIKYSTNKMPSTTVSIKADNHTQGVEEILRKLTDKETGPINSWDEIDAVGHRLVHGGERFAASHVITDEVIAKLKEYIPLAPLHNPANIMGIEAITNVLPKVKQVGVFDTAFHQSMPEKAYLYPVPYELYEDFKVRRYGFHGTSHLYVSHKAAELCGVDINNSKIITAHIGNGGSVTAVLNGKSVDTSMGLTPVEGLMMGTRSGDIDAGVISMLLDSAEWRATALDKYLGKSEIESIKNIEKAKGTKDDEITTILYSAAINRMLNKYSGIKAIAGVGSSDMRDVSSAADEGNHRAALGLEMYDYRIRKYIGSYAAALGGIDILVFTAGVGENRSATRAEACKGLEFMGIELDADKNNQRSDDDFVISTPNSRVKVVVIHTDEEYMIAKDTYELSK